MKILIVTRDQNQKLPIELINLKKRVIWKNNLIKKDLEGIDIIITLGGDGTFLSAAHFIKDQIILGVNDDTKRSEGHLTTTNLKDLNKKIKQIESKNYITKKYTREKVRILKKDKCIITEHALNETYIGNLNPHHPSNYNIKYKNKAEDQKSSGILITTGTGSTAWYKAMGGRRYSKTRSQLRFKIRELFSGRLYGPKIKKGKIFPNEKLTIISKMNYGILAIDSIRSYGIHEEDRIEISIGDPLNVIQ